MCYFVCSMIFVKEFSDNNYINNNWTVSINYIKRPRDMGLLVMTKLLYMRT